MNREVFFSFALIDCLIVFFLDVVDLTNLGVLDIPVQKILHFILYNRQKFTLTRIPWCHMGINQIDQMEIQSIGRSGSLIRKAIYLTLNLPT